MKKVLRFLLLAALMVPLGARAQQTLTVANGTDASEYVPVYGYWADAAQHNQMIYPASMLAPLAGDSIKSLEFYMSETCYSSWGITVTVKVAEVADVTVGELLSPTLTQVWTGTWTGMTDTIHLDFTQGFAYHGGNLLVDVTTTGGNYSRGYFYGVNTPSASIYSYSSSSGSSASSVQSFLPKATFTTVPGAFSFCGPASGFSVQANSFDATFSWNEVSGNTYVLYLGDSLVGDVTSPQVLTGLTPGTIYTAYLVTVCPSGDSSTASAANFFTPCVAFPAPYTEGFEADNSLGCFNMLQTYDSYGSIYPYVYSYNYHSGSASYYFSYDNLVVLPKVDLAANEMHVSFWAYNTGGFMEAGYMTNPDSIGSFVPMLTVPSYTDDEWLEFEFYTDSLPATDTVYIALRHSGDYYSTYIDDITIEQSGACRRPSASAIDSITSTTAYIHWSPNGIGTDYEVAYASVSNPEVANIISDISDDTSYAITGLNPNVMYWFWVRTVCSDSTTAWHYIGHARTGCGDMVAPVIEDFSTQTSYETPTCWTTIASTESYGTVYPYISYDHYLYFYPRYQQPNIIAMPRIDLPANEMSIVVYSHTTSYNPAPLEFGYVTSLDSNAVFNLLGPINATSTSSGAPDEFEFNTSLLPAGLDTIYLAFRSTTNSDYGYSYVDAIEVRHLSNCGRPAAMQLDDVTNITATLSWDEV